MGDALRHLPRAPMHEQIDAKLVNCAAYFLFGQGDDHPFDLAPMAETEDIAVVTAGLGARGGLETGVVAIGFKQQRRIGQRGAVVDERRVHGSPLTRGSLRFGSQIRSTKR